LDIQANFAKLAETPNLSNISSKYHKFTNVFSKTKAEVLTSHHLYDLKINLKEGAQPPVSPIYSLLASEQEALKEFIEKNLNIGFIQPTSSLHSVPVLSIKKRKIVYYTSVLTSTVLTTSSKRIVIYFCSSLIYWTHFIKLRFIQR